MGPNVPNNLLSLNQAEWSPTDIKFLPPNISTLCAYSRVLARQGLRQTALAPGSDETPTRDPLVRPQVDPLR